MNNNSTIKNIAILLLLVTSIFASCTKDDPQAVYILQPQAGEDQLVEKGQTVQLLGTEDGNAPDYGITWSISKKPEGSKAAISNPNSLEHVSFVADKSGTYNLNLKTTAENNQSNQDEMVITVVDDLSKLTAKFVLVNAIEGGGKLSVVINDKVLNTTPIEEFEFSDYIYIPVSGGATKFTFDIGGNTYIEDIALGLEKNYTIVVTGTASNPDIILHENIWNEKTIGATTANDGVRKNDAINAIHAAPGLEEVAFFGINDFGQKFPLDHAIAFRNSDGQVGIGELAYEETATSLIGHGNTALRIDLWVQPGADNNLFGTDKEKSLCDILVVVPFGDGISTAGYFVTVVIVKDSAAETGYRLIYINNTFL